MARGIASTTLISWACTPSAPACSRLMSSRFSTSRISLSSDSSAVASSSSRSASLNDDVGAAQAGHGGLGRRQRGAQVVADRGEQRAAQPVGLADLAGRRGLLGEPFLAQRDRGLGGERLDDPPVGGGEDPSTQDERELVVDRDVDVGLARASRHGVAADAGGDLPGVRRRAGCRACAAASGPTLQQRRRWSGRTSPGPARAARSAVGSPRSTLPATVDSVSRLGPGPGGLGRTAGGQVDHGAHADGDEQEDQQGQQVLPLGDGELVQRWGEEVVEQQEADDRGGQRRVEPADERDRDDEAEEQQDVGVEAEARRGPRRARASAAAGRPRRRRSRRSGAGR